MNPFHLSLILIVLAGLFQGTFGLGMKRFAPLSWEGFWIVFTILGMVLIPIGCSAIVIPDPWTAIRAVPAGDLATSILLGGSWGVGALMFGLAINRIGLSLAYGITMSVAAAMGSLIPLMSMAGAGSNPAVPWVIASIIVMVLGVVTLTWAGVLRDRIQTTAGQPVLGISRRRGFYMGLLFAILNGLGAALLNVGFTRAQPAAQAAISQGVPARNASLVAWVIVLLGGCLVNLAYALYLLIKNRSYYTFASSGASKGLIWAIVTAVLWFAALAVYGQGAAIMGRLGPVIGWSLFLGLSLVVSSILGLKDREWAGMKGPVRILLTGDAVIVASAIMLGYANYLTMVHQ